MAHENEPQVLRTWWRHLLAGGVAGAISRTVISPLEMLRTRMQIKPLLENSLRKELSRIYAEDGVKGFWRGNGISVFRSTIFNALKWSTYDEAKKAISTKDLGPNLRIRIISGSIAGVISQSIVHPIDVVGTCIMSSTEPSSLLYTVRKLNIEGWRAYYRGYIPTMIAAAPFCAIALSTYEGTKELLNKYNWPKKIPPCIPVASSALGSTLAITVTYPLLMSATIMQSKKMNGGYSTILRTIFKLRGIRGVYSGYLASAFRSILDAEGFLLVGLLMCYFFMTMIILLFLKMLLRTGKKLLSSKRNICRGRLRILQYPTMEHCISFHQKVF